MKGSKTALAQAIEDVILEHQLNPNEAAALIACISDDTIFESDKPIHPALIVLSDDEWPRLNEALAAVSDMAVWQ